MSKRKKPEKPARIRMTVSANMKRELEARAKREEMPVATWARRELRRALDG